MFELSDYSRVVIGHLLWIVAGFGQALYVVVHYSCCAFVYVQTYWGIGQFGWLFISDVQIFLGVGHWLDDFVADGHSWWLLGH